MIFSFVGSGAKKFKAVGLVPYSIIPWVSTPVAQEIFAEFFSIFETTTSRGSKSAALVPKILKVKNTIKTNNKRPIIIAIPFLKIFVSIFSQIYANTFRKKVPIKINKIPGIPIFITLSKIPLCGRDLGRESELLSLFSC